MLQVSSASRHALVEGHGQRLALQQVCVSVFNGHPLHIPRSGRGMVKVRFQGVYGGSWLSAGRLRRRYPR